LLDIATNCSRAEVTLNIVVVKVYDKASKPAWYVITWPWCSMVCSTTFDSSCMIFSQCLFGGSCKGYMHPCGLRLCISRKEQL